MQLLKLRREGDWRCPVYAGIPSAAAAADRQAGGGFSQQWHCQRCGGSIWSPARQSQVLPHFSPFASGSLPLCKSWERHVGTLKALEQPRLQRCHSECLDSQRVQISGLRLCESGCGFCLGRCWLARRPLARGWSSSTSPLMMKEPA